MEPSFNHSPSPPEQGIIAETAYLVQEELSDVAKSHHERRAVNASVKAERLRRYQNVAGEVLEFAGINSPTPEPTTSEPPVPPKFIQRRREKRWANHAAKRQLNGYDRSLHSPYGGTWQGGLMKITSSVSRFFARKEVGKSYKSGVVSAVEALQERTVINSRSSRDFISEAVHDGIARTSSTFSGDTLLRARTHGFNRAGRIERLDRKVGSHLDKAEKAEERSKILSENRTQLKKARKDWQSVKRTQPIV